MSKKKTFRKVDISNKNSKITIYKINQIIRANKDKLEDYEKLDDVSKLKKGNFIKYIRLDKEKAQAKLSHGGKVIDIKKKPNNDYIIRLVSNVTYEWNILYSNVVIFYKTKTVLELRREKVKKWKEDFKKRDPQGYKKWLREKKRKQSGKKISKRKKSIKSKKSKKKKSKKKCIEKVYRLVDIPYYADRWLKNKMSYAFSILAARMKKDFNEYVNLYKQDKRFFAFWNKLNEAEQYFLADIYALDDNLFSYDELKKSIEYITWVSNNIDINKLSHINGKNYNDILNNNAFDFAEFIFNSNENELAKLNL